MSHLPHSAKSASHWGTNELSAYNITIQFQDTASFFGLDPLPQPSVSNELLTNLNANEMIDRSNCGVVRFIDRAIQGESAVIDLAIYLLKLLGYEAPQRLACSRANISLSICGKQCHAIPGVCIMDYNEHILLLVQEDKQLKKQRSPEPQLIAKAIAAFQTNARHRLTHDEDPIDAEVIPGIILTGSSPIFYKIPVTQTLAQAVQQGQFPATPAIVYAHLPIVARPDLRENEGMKPLDNRRQMLACFEAFKQFVN